MSEAEETYCRLCAEQTPKDQLISSNEDVALSSKIATKMLWINIDISTPSPLPTTICFSCFDLLERTWSFLHNVRSAQEKLTTIFCPKLPIETVAESCASSAENIGKPVNKNWEDFETSKSAVKVELDEIPTIDPESLLRQIKKEYNSDVDYNEFNTAFSSDSDVPLKVAANKKKLRKKKKILYEKEVFEEDLIKTEKVFDVIDGDVSWDEYMCRCAHCDASCKNIQSLRLHSLQIHESCCVFKCSDCGKVIANFKNFISHVRTHERLLRYFCEYCGLKYAYLKRHIRKTHGDIKLTMCRNCGCTFENEIMLQEHLLLYAKSTKRSKKRNKAESERDLICEYCSKEFKTQSNLQQHRLVHSERTRDYACHICGSMFFTKGTLSTHIMTHEDSKPYKCEFCPLSFRARGNLMSHISLHSDTKPFVCDKCGKSFRVKRHLKSHSIMHTDLMPYVCTYCNKQFRFKTRLNLHLRQHTGAKPYTCIYCQRDFTNGSNYKKHMKRRHNFDTSKRKYNNVLDDSINIRTVSSDNNDLKIVSSVQTVSDVQAEEIII